ncbi:hypothetical protein E3N88_29819 [Mikania micrantha]|uniref:Uncharacterized protein n=1 Tax=Mikania micrantha TaxID=192012 RepID=A0A5N6MKI8_9ASTR|nr:hypothetical protein E3N88_29819 [Mikania micrantha]
MEHVCTDPLSNQFLDLFSIESSKGCKIPDGVRVIGGLIRIQFQWTVQALTSTEQQQVSTISNLIGSFQFNQGNDGWRWNIGIEGEFTVQSIKRALQVQ